MWTLWALLIALPLGVLVTGSIMFARSGSKDVRPPQAAEPMLLEQGAAYFVEWLVTGIVIGVIYRPLAPC